MIQYALLLGMLACFNPCGAPLLPAYLGLFSMTAEDESAIRRVHRAVYASSAMSLGFLAVFIAVGLPLSAIASAISRIGPGMIGLLGIAIAAATILSLRGTALPAVGAWLGFRGGRGTTAMLTYGAIYALGSLGCELPLFVAATGVASTRNAGAAAAATIAYGVGMGLTVTALSVIVALLGRRRRLRLSSPWVRGIGAVVAISSGLYLVIYAAAEIWMPTVATVLSAPLSQGEESAQQMMSFAPLWWAIALAAVIVVASAGTAAVAVVHDRGQKRA